MKRGHAVHVERDAVERTRFTAKQRLDLVDGRLHDGRRLAELRVGKLRLHAISRRHVAALRELHPDDPASAPRHRATPDGGIEEANFRAGVMARAA